MKSTSGTWQGEEALGPMFLQRGESRVEKRRKEGRYQEMGKNESKRVPGLRVQAWPGIEEEKSCTFHGYLSKEF